MDGSLGGDQEDEDDEDEMARKLQYLDSFGILKVYESESHLIIFLRHNNGTKVEVGFDVNKVRFLFKPIPIDETFMIQQEWRRERHEIVQYMSPENTDVQIDSLRPLDVLKKSIVHTYKDTEKKIKSCSRIAIPFFDYSKTIEETDEL